MILDTSAIVAVLLGEAEAEQLTQALLRESSLWVGAPTLAEAAVVLQARLGSVGLSDLRGFLVEFDVRVLPFGDDHWRLAASCYARYGRGRHPAGLNFGDCLTYAVSKLAAQPLLCAGADFAQTDLSLVPLGDQTAGPAGGEGPAAPS